MLQAPASVSSSGGVATLSGAVSLASNEANPTVPGSTVSASIQLNSDSDNIGDALESAAPNGGDGNNDGTADQSQNNVASLHNFTTLEYATLASPSNTVILNVQAVDNPSSSDAPAATAFSSGFFDFSVQGLTITTTTVDLVLPVGTVVLSYWKYGPEPSKTTPHWYEFIFDVVTGTGITINNNIVTLHSVDGGRGDDDLTFNGTIVDARASIIAPAELSIAEIDSVDPVLVTGQLVDTFTVPNAGPSIATEVTLTDTLPANATFVSAASSQGSCAQVLGVVTCAGWEATPTAPAPR